MWAHFKYRLLIGLFLTCLERKLQFERCSSPRMLRHILLGITLLNSSMTRKATALCWKKAFPWLFAASQIWIALNWKTPLDQITQLTFDLSRWRRLLDYFPWQPRWVRSKNLAFFSTRALASVYQKIRRSHVKRLRKYIKFKLNLKVWNK